MHLAVGREEREESHFSPPLAIALISQSCWEAAPVCLQKGQQWVSHLSARASQLAPLPPFGKAVLVLAASEQEECAAVIKVGADLWAVNASLLCFQPSLEQAWFSGWGIIITVPKGGI